MKTTLVLVTIITAALTGSVFAENGGKIMPPPGPYISITDVGQYGLMQNVQDDSKGGEEHVCTPAMRAQHNRVAPEWQRRHQAQMESRMNQSNRPQIQTWNSQPPQRNYNQRPPMPNTYSGQMPVFQDNRMQQPFPPVRGSVYGQGMQGMPPADFYRQPMQPPTRY